MFILKRKILSVFIGLLLSCILFSCDTNEATDSNKQIKDGLTLVENQANNKFIALYKKENKILRFEAVQIKEKINTSISYEGTNNIISKINIPEDKKEVPELVNLAALKTQRNLTNQKLNISKISNLYNSFLHDLSSIMFKIKNIDLASTITLHNAIINSAKRIRNKEHYVKGKNKPCTSYAGYIKGTDPFVCLEDMVMEIETLKKRLNKMGKSFSDFGIAEEIKKLQNQGQKTINGKEFTTLIKKSTPKANRESKNPSIQNLKGCDYGCCGNYEGDCIYSSMACLYHDVWCRNCDHGILCGPSCSTEPCD